MIKRTTNLSKVLRSVEPYLPLKGFEPEKWLQDGRNIALIDDKGNLNLFEYVDGFFYDGHYFYKHRGRKAIEASKKALEYMFKTAEVKVIRGFTPHEHKGAMWMSKHLGFKSYGSVDIDDEPYEIFMMTKKEYTEHE